LVSKEFDHPTLDKAIKDYMSNEPFRCNVQEQAALSLEEVKNNIQTKLERISQEVSMIKETDTSKHLQS